MVGGYRLVALDDLDRQVGKNISDIHGLVRFTGMPAGRFRVLVEKRRNDRGGISTVQVGQIILNKRLKSAVEATSGEKSGQPVEEKKPEEKKPLEEQTPAKKSEEK